MACLCKSGSRGKRRGLERGCVHDEYDGWGGVCGGSENEAGGVWVRDGERDGERLFRRGAGLVMGRRAAAMLLSTVWRNSLEAVM